MAKQPTSQAHYPCSFLRGWGWKAAAFHPLFLVSAAFLFQFIGAYAQDVPTNAPIAVDVPVSDSISDAAPFDIWQFPARAGEQYRAEMQASESLAPLLGLRALSGDILVASNQFDDGTTQDATPGDVATIFFEIPASGDYALVATRVGTDGGTTQGTYSLNIVLISSAPEPDDTYVDVVFRCGSVNATTAASIQLDSQLMPENGFQITVYGLEGFDPVVRLMGDDGRVGSPCEFSSPPEDPVAFEFNIGDYGTFTFGAADLTGIARVEVASYETGAARITIGSHNGAPGRFVMHISGLAVETAGDVGSLTVRGGPFAKDTSLTLWMLRDGLSRLDPILVAPEGSAYCVDIGLRSCADALAGAGLRLLSDGLVQLSSDLLDAIVVLEVVGTQPVELTAASQNLRSTGAYSLWIIGELPPRP